MTHQATRRLRSRHAGSIAAIAAVFGAGVLASAAAVAAQSESPALKARPADAGRNAIGEAFHYVADNSYYRVGVLYFNYVGDSSRLTVENAQGLAAQAFGPGRSRLDNSGSSAGNKLTLGGTYGLYLPFTARHLAVELALAPPLKLDFQITGDAANRSVAPAVSGPDGQAIPTGIPAIGHDIGSFKTLPPTVTFVYRPWVGTLVEPYIGVGASYLYTYDTQVSNTVLDAVNEPTLYLSKPVACVGQLGADFNLPQNMFVSADVKYIGCADVKTRLNDVQVNSPTLSPTFGPIDVGTVSSTNHFRAVTYQLSFGMRF